MNENILAAAARLSDDALLRRLKSLAVLERDATVELVAHLAELHGRRGHLGEGPGSLYHYCRSELGLSEDAAYNRDAAARAVRRFPVILDRLADGSINLTTVRVLRTVLTEENHLALLAEARHRSKAEVEVIARRVDPKPDVPSSIRRLPTPAPVVATPVRQSRRTRRAPYSRPLRLPRLSSARSWRRWRRSVTACSSRCRRRLTTSCARCRTCCA